MAGKSIYWYDFETFGKDPKRDRASQFAGVRTDEDLNIIGEPLLLYCKPSPDFLPEPMACYITGILPQTAAAQGVCEREFIERILAEFAEPGTCVAGYNSLRFDDEMTRQLLYRNFHDPYEREYKNGNSRWDLIDVVRLCAGVRPEGINWPIKEDGSRSFRLDQLTVANGIEHGAAHDALADVIATIEIAKLLRSAQPKLYDYAYNSRSKVAVRAQFDLVTQKPVVFVSMAFPARLGCLSLVMPLCAHPTNTNAIIACDLRVDPTHWLGLSGEELAARLYKRRSDLPVGEDPLPLHVIATNKCPVVAPLGVLDETVAAEYGVDKSVWLPHFEAVRAKRNVAATVTKAFSQAGEGDPETDPDFMIYSGFFGDSDKKLMQTVRRSAPADLGRLDIPFRDLRLKEMLFRYRARNYPETLTEEEVVVWREFCLNRINDPEARKKYDLGFAEALERGGDAARPLLDELNAYVASLPIAAGNQ